MSDDNDESVGYRKPPIAHRIKPAEVRNPWGRKGKPREPRKKTDFLSAPFALKMDGKTVIVTRDDAIDFALFKEAVAGKVSAAKELSLRQRQRALVAKNEPVAEDLASEDKQAFQHFLERELQKMQLEPVLEPGTPSSPQGAKKGRRG